MERKVWKGVAAWVLATIIAASAPAHAAVVPTGPDPSLDPAETVDAMLAALKKNTDKGIAELFNFSSPGNKQKTGPLSHFAEVMHQGFPDMLGHRAARQAPALVDGSRAMIAVELVGSDAQVHHYGFVLSLQKIPACNGCWMADAVINLDDQVGPGGDGDGGDGGDDDAPPEGPRPPEAPLTTPT